MPFSQEQIESVTRDLPDPEGARLFYERIAAEQPRVARALERDAGLLADTLALAAWSPFLGTTLTQHTEYFSWLARERTHASVRTAEELGESLARFALTNSQLPPQVLLARFRRRELLRLYLHDIRGARTLVETTEELSNLADAVLSYALSLARQELDNRYGAPLVEDERGRSRRASFCVVALGKLGSRELNYASDIDLLFLYSDDGATAGTGARGQATSREYFNRLAASVAKIVGEPTGEGAAYRVDLRLRPHGRDGALSCSLAEAARYYREKAQAWELQALIRARAAAGDAALYARFAAEVRHRVYRTTETVEAALAHVRLAKRKIDRQHMDEARGFNVKLGRGGIREIEFIAQALQLACGGRDEWLRAAHTLISLGRLADRALITERERSALSDAYVFLRALEHRLQMEHGLQTHTLPDDPARRLLVARRMGFAAPDALVAFERALHTHTTCVRAAYDRVFGFGDTDVAAAAPLPGGQETWPPAEAALAENLPAAANSPTPENIAQPTRLSASLLRFVVEPAGQTEAATLKLAATIFAAHARRTEDEREEKTIERITRTLAAGARISLNPQRAISLIARVAASLDKSEAVVALTEESLASLVRLCGASEFFGEIIAGSPALIAALAALAEIVAARDYAALLRAAVEGERNFAGEMAALRREWARLLVEIGAQDTAGALSLREANRRQGALARASADAACLMAERELARRYGSELIAAPRLAVLGLGRLGSGGFDYGSDLDVVLIYDDERPSPVAALTTEEAYARYAETLVTALSSVTREGYLYRVDLRLRPDGKNGPIARGASSFLEYLRERANVWEWLAYVKLHAAAGDMELGERIETEGRREIHAAAKRAGAQVLRAETRRVRERLERERARRAAYALDIKYGPGGMLDVYFAARFLQLRDDIPDETEDRSTLQTLARLREAGSLDEADERALSDGYALLRALDHYLRLIAGRSTRLPAAADHPVLRDLARCAGYASVAALTDDLAARMQEIRAAYERITAGGD